MNRLRVPFFSLCAVVFAAFPLFVQGATTDFKVLLNTDNDVATGCTLSGLAGVDQVFVTRVETTDTTATITRTFRQVCSSTAGLGAEIDIESAIPAGFQPAAGLLLAESRIPFSAFGTALPHNMRIGVEATQNALVHRELNGATGSPVYYPLASSHRRSVGAPGADRLIVMDGAGTDWNGLNALFDGIASGGSTGLRMLKVFAHADVTRDWLYFRFDANLDANAPFAVDDSYTRAVGESLSIPAPGVLENDGDPAGAPLTATPLSPPGAGTVVLNPDGSFTYTPDDASSTATDSFEYRASNDTKSSNAATVTIAVSTTGNSVPVGGDDAFSTDEDVDLNVAAPGVLANDTDADGDPLTATLVTAPSQGTVVLNADGGFTYAPANDYFGTDVFVYSVSDGTDTDTATVTITIVSVNDAPTVPAQSFTVPENSAAGTVVGTVTVNDPDTADSHSFAILAGNLSGAFDLDALTGVITVANPAALNFEATPEFVLSVRAEDNGTPVLSDTGTITIGVSDVNELPVASNGDLTTDEDTPAGVTIAATDPDGDALTYTVLSGPDNGSLSGTAPNLTYTPFADYNGPDAFTFSASDGAGTSNVATVSITVLAVNDVPVATADAYAVNEGGTLNETAATGVLANDSDPDNSITAILVSGPANAAAFTLNADGSFTYTHDGSETTSDSFTYKANDGTLDSGTVTVSITINPVNDAPVAVADGGYIVAEGGAIVGAASVLGNDTDAEGSALTAVLVSGPANAASFTLNADGTFNYTHDGGETIADSFTYRANDGSLDSNVVTVSITITPVNDAPVAVADSGYTVAEAGTITGAASVLGNDTDAENDTLTAVLVSGPSNAASFTLNPDGTFDYTHDGSETTSDSFTYRANDGALDSNTVTVSITVTAVNDAPVAVDDSGYTVDEGATLAGVSVLGNDTDAEGSTLTAALVSGPANAAAFTLNPDGTFSYTHDGSETVVDSFTYRANDGSLDSNIATVTIVINPVNDAPVAVADSGYTVDEGGTITGAATVLGNDTDAEGTTLNAVLVSGPSNAASFTLNADGTFDYTHDGGETTSDSFTYHANDGALDSNTVTVSITVNPVNDAPVAVADAYAVDEGGTLNEAAGTGVLANDSDPDNSITAILVSGPANAAAFTLNADGSFTYTHDGSETTSDSFTYKANDGTLDSGTVTVSITINPVNDAPVAVADGGYIVAEGGAIVGAASVLGNDTDAEGSALTAVLVSGPANAASFTLNADGTFNYTHDGGETIADGFTYRANDGSLDSNVVTVSITITPVNDAPVAVADSGYTVAEAGTITGAASVLGNDTDAENDTLTAVLVSGPSNASSFTLNPDGTFDYTHDGSETTSDSFTYRANDGALDSNTVTVSITVTAVNDAPVAVDDSGYTVDEGATLAGASVLGNDTDAEGSTLTAALVSGPANAAAFTLNADGTFSYTHDGSETVVDSFTYRANDGSLDSNIATVTIVINPVNDAPVAVADSGYTVDEGGSITGAATVLGNDIDAEGTTLNAVLVSGPSNASSFTLNGDGTFDYTHNGGETTSDSFTYRANDGALDSNTVTVSITVNAINDAPVLTVPGAQVVDEDTPLLVTAGVTDADAGSGTSELQIGCGACGITLASTTGLNITTGDGINDASIVATGTMADINAAIDGFTFQGQPESNGADTITIIVSDFGNSGGGGTQTDTETISVTVTAVNDAPVAVADSGYTVDEGGTLTGAATVLGNDSDADFDTLNAVLVSGPANASSFTLYADGTFDYTHDGGETTSDSFTYKANDGALDSNTVTVSITVNAINDAPVATADGYTVAEGGTLNESAATGVLANDSDADSSFTAVLVSGPANAASFTLNADGSFDYTHDGSETTTDSFTYKANDGALDSGTVTVTITVTPVNDAPVAVADGGYTVDEGGTITAAATVLGNDTDAENDTLTAVLVSGPANASSFTLNADGTFDYTHNGSETTSDSFTYKANDGALDSNTVTVSITVNPVNDAPVAVADSGYTVDEAGTITGAATVLGNDTDAENDTLTAILVSGPSNASAFTLNADGTFDYTHDGSETVSDSFTYKANDGALDSNTVTVSITVNPINDAPVAVADSGYVLAEGGTITGAATVLGNDTDAENDTLAAVLVSGPSNASSFTLNSDGTFDYTHDGSETTSDSFTYKANDGALDSNTVTVSITITAVNDAPVAVADSGYAVDEAGTITGATTVLGNDTDAENDTLTAVLVSGPSNASAFTLNSDGTFDYTHDGSETTSDSFTYKANDGALDSNTVTVSITVNPINDAPVATADSYTVAEGGTLNENAATGVLANDTDVDSSITAVLVAGPSNASSFTLNADGSFDYTHDGSETITDSFTYKANDGTLDSGTVAVTITVTPVNDAPVAVADSGYTVAEGGTITGAATVLGNDTDGENDTLTAVLVSGPSNASAFTLNSDGTFDYTHDGGETTSDSFTYKANDGTADSNTVTVSITVTAVNDAPVAVADSGYTLAEGGTITGAATVLGNDTDVENDTLTAVLVSSPSNASAFTLNSDGTFDYTHDGSETTSDSFTYKANDGTADSNTVTVSITVTAVNDAPVAVADSGYTLAEGGTITGAATVLGNDTDAENDTLTAVLVSGPSNASAFTLNSDGTFDYTHDGGETTSDSFTYKANDGTADSNTVTVSITVTAVNDAPVAVADSGYTLAEGGNITGAATVLGNDTDAENDTLTAVLVSGPSNASAFTLNSDGTFDYTHDGSETTSDSFTYKANDGTADSNTVTVSITVTAVNDAPVAVADSGYTVNEGGTITGAVTVLGNDTDAENDTLTAVLVSGPSNASSFTLSSDGTFDYTHDGGESSSDSFTYKANDGTADSNTVTVSITVTAVNDAPVAVADSGYTFNEGSTNSGAATVLGNDTDAENDTLTAVLVSGPSNASSFTLNSDGTFDYTHDGSETLSDSFTYKANDGTDDSNTVTVSITITAVNDPPVAVADSGYSVDEGGTITNAATVLANDSDAELSPLTAILVSGPANASSFTLDSDGTFDYTHNGGETTSDSFTYKANDGTADSNTVTVSITVDPVNDIPSFTKGPDIDADSAAGAHTSNPWATAISAGTGETQNVSFVIDSNDNLPLFATAPAVSPTGVLTFDPVFGATGVANISLHIEDDGGTANGGLDASAPQSFVISLDASPTVNSTDPAESDVVATNKQVTVTFNEPVTLVGTWFQIVCGTSGTHDPGNSTVGGSGASRTIDTAGFSGGESCAMTIFGAQVTDDDTIDPPNVMSGNVTVNFTVDAAPTVSSTTPTNAATNQKTDLDIVITFSEAVTAGNSDFTIECPAPGNLQAFSATGTGTNTITLNPTADLPAGTTCTVKVLTTVVDSDTVDPPNALASVHSFTFTTDAQPAVTTVSPVDESTDNVRTTNITVNFSENVDTSLSSFTIKCPSTGTAIGFAFVGASTNTNTVTLNPSTDLPDGERCEVTVIANQVNDTDTNDPPANLAADFTFQFGVEPNADDDAHPHTLVGNVSSNTDGFLSVVTNDDFPVAFPITSMTFDATTVNGGAIVMNTTIGDPNFGEFTYDPAPGFEGADTFTYTINTANGSDTGTVTINVSGMVWFIDQNDGTGPFDGRLGSPFQTLAQFEAVNGNADVPASDIFPPQAGDNIFLYQSGTAYSGPVTLENGQKLIGQDSATAAFGAGSITNLTAAASQPALPGVNSGDGVFVSITSGSNGVVLAANNHVRGLRFGNNTGLAMTGGAVGTLTVADALINNGAGGGISLTGGTTVSVSLASVSTTGGTHGISLNNVTGTVSSSGGTITNPTTAGISITGQNASVTHSGTITTNGRPALLTSNLTGGSISLGTVNVSGTGAGNDGVTLDGTGNAVDLTISSATINVSNMDDGVTLSDLGVGSDVTFSAGSITASGAGRRVIEFLNTTNCTCNFSTIALNANSSDGLSLGSGQLGTYTFQDIDVNTPNGGIGVQVVGDANSANVDSSVTFRSIDVATCSQKGIYVHSHSGSFTVNGTGAANSGGTISNCTQHGAKFGNDGSANTGAKNITLTDMAFTGNGTANLGTAGTCGDLINGTNTNCAAGIDLQQANTVSLTRVAITDGVQNGLNGKNVTALTLNNVDVTNAGNEANENGVNLHNLFGTSTWTQLDATENAGSQMEIQNSSSTALNLTINGGTFSNAAWPGSLTSSHGVLFSGTNNAQMTLSLQSANIARNFGPAFQTDTATGADITVTINGGTMIDNGQHFVFAGTGSGDVTYTVTNISQMYVDPAHSGVTPISIARGDGASGTFTGVIQGNTIGNAGIANSGACLGGCNIISVRNNGSSGGFNRVTIGGTGAGQGNTLQRSGGGGINVTSGLNVSNDSGTMQVKIIGNTLTGPDGVGTGLPITIVNGTNASDTSQTCADVLNNSINGASGSGSWNLSAGIRLRHVQNNTVYRLPGYTGGGTDTTAVQTYLENRNTITGGNAAAALGGGTYGNTSPAGSQCF